MSRPEKTSIGRIAALGITACATLAVAAGVFADERVVPDTYLAVTANMTPADVELKADILRWSTPTDREAVIAALQSEEPSIALRELPSMGVIWRSNSSVGNAVKYAYKTETGDGGQSVTLVTDRPLGYSHYQPWQADEPTSVESLEYSVVELTVGSTNNGQGTLSLAATVAIDTDANLVTLDRGDSTPLLTNVRLAPKPYWAQEQ